MYNYHENIYQLAYQIVGQSSSDMYIYIYTYLTSVEIKTVIRKFIDVFLVFQYFINYTEEDKTPSVRTA